MEASKKTHFPITHEYATSVLKNVEQVFSKWGQIESCKVIGSESFGYSIAVVVDKKQTDDGVFPGIPALPPVTVLDGVPISVRVKNGRSSMVI